ncbi:phage holin, lambda family [Orbus sturtevantii]|uniref:phage holin, lambda family n=1 Tax=Orbus sturtevantii TaxID=3074109 RepID=UPI00370D4CC4
MADNNFNLLQIIYITVIGSPIWCGAILATIIAGLRVLYDNHDITLFRVLIEALLCGALALCVGGLVERYNLPESAIITIAGAIGLIGFTTLRDKVLKILNRKIDKED